MLSTVMTQLALVASACLNAVAGIVVLWPVAVMAGFLVLGVAIGFITKLAGGRSRKKRGR